MTEQKREFLMYGQRGQDAEDPLAEGSIWDQGRFAPLEEHLEAMWKGEAEAMLKTPGDPSPEARSYVLGYVRGCRVRERYRREFRG